MSEKLEIINPEIPKEDQVEIMDDQNPKCIMLKEKIFNGEMQADYYSCEKCQKFEAKICRECKFKCHLHDKTEKDLLKESSTKGYIKIVKCSCHFFEHRVVESKTEVPEKEKVSKSLGDKCYFEEVANEFGFDIIAKENDNNNKDKPKYYCYGCYLSCIKDSEKESFELVSKEALNSKVSIECSCSVCKKDSMGGDSDKRERIIRMMNKIIDNYKNEKFINIKSFLPKILISNTSLYDYFIKPISEFITKLAKNNWESKQVNSGMETFKSGFPAVKKILKMFKKLIKIYKKDTFNFISDIKSLNITQYEKLCTNFKFCDFELLCKARLSLKPEKGRTSEPDIKNINKFVYYILYFIRKIFLEKVLDSKRLFDCKNVIENLTPFHRSFQKLTSSQVCANLKHYGVTESSFIYLHNILYGNNNLILGNNRSSFLVVKEYFKWCTCITSIQDNLDKHRKICKGEIMDKFTESFSSSFIKDKIPEFKEFLGTVKESNSELINESKIKVELRKLSTTIQKFVLGFIITTNDYAFVKFFNSYRWDNDNDWEDNFDSDLNNIDEHDYGHFYKLLKAYISNRENYLTWVQNYAKNRTIFAFTKGKFEDFFLEIFYLLFFTNTSDIKIDQTIYNCLLTEGDLYISSIQNFFDTEEKYDINIFPNVSILSPNGCCTRRTNYQGLEYDYEKEEIPNELEDINNAIKSFKDNKRQYYNGQSQNKTLKIEDSFLTDLNKYSNQFLSTEKKNSFDENSDLVQSKAVKLGLFDILLDYYHMLSTDFYVIYNYQKTHGKDYVNKLKNSILEIFKLYFNNAFLLPFFLSKNTLLILSNETVLPKNPTKSNEYLASYDAKEVKDDAKSENYYECHKNKENKDFYDKNDINLDYNNEHNIKNNFSIEQINFYIDFIHQAKIKKFKFDFTNLVKVCLNTDLEYVPNDYLDEKENLFVEEKVVNNDEDYSDSSGLIEPKRNSELKKEDTKIKNHYSLVIQMIKLLKLCLKNNISDTLNNVNLLIWKYLLGQNFKKFFIENNFDQFTDMEKKVFLEILTLINNLNDNYYYNMFRNDEIMQNIYSIWQKEKIKFDNLKYDIKNNDNQELTPIIKKKLKLLSEELKVFSYTYAKYYIISPYIIKKDLSLLYEGEKGDTENKILKPFVALRDRKDIKQLVDDISKFNLSLLKEDINYITIAKKEVKFEGKEEIINLELTLGPLYENFENYKLFLIKVSDIKEDRILFKSFEKMILIPSIYIIFRLLYFSHEMTADIKYLTYKTIYLFFNCYQEFLKIIIEKLIELSDSNKDLKLEKKNTFNKISTSYINANTFKVTNPRKNLNPINDEPKKKEEENVSELSKLIPNFFILDDNQQDIKIYLQNLSDCLDIDLNEVENNPLNVNLLLKKFTKYLTNIKKSSFLNSKNLVDKEEIFLNFEKANQKIKKIDIGQKKLMTVDNKFRAILAEFILSYNDLKANTDLNFLLDLFFNKSATEYEFYLGMLDDMFSKCLGMYDQPYKFIKDKKIHKIFFYQSDYLDYFKSFNIITKSNPKAIQDYFLTKTTKVYYKNYHLKNPENQEYEGSEIQVNIDDLVKNIVRNLKILYQYVFIDFHKLNDTSNCQILDKSTPEYGFVDVIEFLRLLCENHNQEFQHKLCKKIDIADKMTLFEFLLEFCTLIQEHYENYLKHENTCKFFKKNSYEFFEELIRESTDFLIEAIQGSRTASIFDKSKNRFVKRYLDKANRALEVPKKTENLGFLKQFLHFIVSLLEENAFRDNKKDSKKEQKKDLKKDIIEGIIPNKIVEILILSIRRLFRVIVKLIIYIHYPFYLKRTEDVEKFDEFLDKKENERLKEIQKKAIENFNNKKPMLFMKEIVDSFQFWRKWFINDESIKSLDNYIKELNGLKYMNNDEDINSSSFSNKKKNRNLNFSEILFDYYLSFPRYFDEDTYFTVAKYAIKFLYLGKAFKIKKIESIINDNIKQYEGEQNSDEFKTLDQHGKWKVHAFLFFKKIMKEVEITETFHYIKTDDDKEENKQETITNIFFVDSDVLRLKEPDFDSFKNTAPYEDKNAKLTELLKHLPKLEIKMILNKSICNENQTIQLFSKLNNLNIVYIYISVGFALLVNFLSLMYNSYLAVGPSSDPFSQLILEEKCSNFIFYINLLHLIFLLLVFINWFFFRVYKLKNANYLTGGWRLFSFEPDNELNEEEKNEIIAKEESKIEFFELVKSFVNKNFYLALNFVCGLIGLLNPNWHFIYSIQLFIIFELFETMGTIIQSVQMRWQQFCAAGFIIIICALIFAAVKFYFFCTDPESDECNRFLFAFLSMVSLGVRAGNGLGLEMKGINDEGYILEFLVEWIFYFVVILVLLNIINGIIVDTFQEQREALNTRNDSKENICYICNTDRSYFEKHGIDYEEHINNTHSLINYFQYMLTIKRSDEQNLNSLDSSIREKITNNQTDFFPPEKKESQEEEEEGNSNEENEEEEEKKGRGEEEDEGRGEDDEFRGEDEENEGDNIEEENDEEASEVKDGEK